jgi:hypothetical protein
MTLKGTPQFMAPEVLRNHGKGYTEKVPLLSMIWLITDGHCVLLCFGFVYHSSAFFLLPLLSHTSAQS